MSDTRILRLAVPLAAALSLATIGDAVSRSRALHPELDALRPLVEAVGSRRLIEARIAGGFRFGPLVGTRRRGSLPDGEDIGLLTAVAEVRRRAERQPAAANRHAAAAALLLLGDPQGALEELQRLTRDNPRDPRLLSDMAAAYLARADSSGGAANYPAALDVARLSLELDPRSAEAQFNEALALERLGLREGATRAWRKCAGLSGTGDWSGTVAEHLAQLASQRPVDVRQVAALLDAALPTDDRDQIRAALDSSVEGSRLYFEGHLLWSLNGDAMAAAAAIQHFGAAFAEYTGDDTILRVAQHLHAHVADPDELRRHVEYSEARRCYVETRWAEAARRFGDLAPALRASGSPLAPWAELHVAILDFQMGRVTAAQARLERLRMRADRQPLLLGRIEWMLGIIAVSAGRFDEALQDDLAGGRHFSGARDVAHAAYMSFLAAEVLDYLGRPALAWSYRLETLQQLNALPDHTRRINVLAVSGDYCAAAGWSRAAIPFHQEAAALAALHGTPADRILAELGLTSSVSRVDAAAAKAHLATAERLLTGIQDAVLRDRLAGETQRVAAEMGARSPDETARSALDEAITWLDSRRAWARVAPLYLARGLRRANDGDREGARGDLNRVIFLTSGMRAPAEDLRVSHAQLAVQAYDRLIELEVDGQTDPVDALALAEGRWRAVDYGFSVPPRGSLSTGLQHRLRPDVVIVGFVPTEHLLLSWTMTAAGVVMRRHAISRRELESEADAFTNEVRSSGPSASFLHARRLHDLLFEPRAAALAAAKRVIVIPAGPLSRLPYALLRDARNVRLGERVELSLLPSLAALRADTPISGGRPDVLAIGFASGGADLPRLGRVEDEVRSIGGFSDGEVLLAAQASKAEILKRAPGARVIHFAGHAINNDERPMQSSLIVAGRNGSDDYLTAEEISRLDLRHTQVVVLSTCAAAASSRRYGEGTLSIARAFLAAGARAVIAPLWEVSDTGMPHVALRIHESLRSGRSAAAAVTDAFRMPGATATERSDAMALVALTSVGATVARRTQ